VKQVSLFLVIVFFFPGALIAQQADTLKTSADAATTVTQTKVDSTLPSPDTIKKTVHSPLKPVNKLLNTDAEPIAFQMDLRVPTDRDSLFYIIAGLALLLAFLKYVYSRYFVTLFRVFFNTSLKQSQLTDQLLQSKLPSLLFNLFFILSAGIYAYLLLSNYRFTGHGNWMTALFCVAFVGVTYVLKFCTLKFTGWVTGISEVTNTYIFVIFLINKIIGVFLLPFTVIIAFAALPISRTAALVSLLCIGLFLLLRFFRSYGLLQNQLKISKFHFMLYIIGIELLPLLLIYKALMVYFK
jgi:Domain of unknown function (DUF4271)